MTNSKKELHREAINQAKTLLASTLILIRDLGASVYIKAELREPGTNSLLGKINTNLKNHWFYVHEIHRFEPERDSIVPGSLGLKANAEVLFDIIKEMTMEDVNE